MPMSWVTYRTGSPIFSPYFAGGEFASGLAALASLDSNDDGLPDYQQSLFQTDRTLFVKLGYAWEL